jgi:hypothetical protein
MTRSFALACVAAACSLASSITACRKSDAPEPYTGAITAERIAIAHERVKIRADWEDAIAEIESEAGKATWGAIDLRAWAVVEDGKCSSLVVKRKRTYVGSVRYQPPIGPSAESDYDECMEVAGPVRSAAR